MKSGADLKRLFLLTTKAVLIIGIGLAGYLIGEVSGAGQESVSEPSGSALDRPGYNERLAMCVSPGTNTSVYNSSEGERVFNRSVP